MRAFADGIHIAGADAVAQFASSGQFHRRHMHTFAAALARLYAGNPVGLPDPLRKVLSHSKLKDGKHLLAVSHDLLTIVGSGAFPLQERKRLIELSAATRGTTSETVDGFIKTLKLLAVTVRAIDTQMLDQEEPKRALSGVVSCQKLGVTLGMLARRATPGSFANRESNDPELEANWIRFMTESRQPEALLAYAQLMRSHFQTAEVDNNDSDYDSDHDSDSDFEATVNYEVDDDKPDLLETVNLLADAVVWSSDKKKAFAELRYDTEASTHLTLIANNAPSTWAAWRQEASAQRIDGQAVGNSSVHPMHYLRQRIVLDAHVPAQTYPRLERVLHGNLDIADAIGAAEPGSEEQRLLQLLDPAATAQHRTGILQELIARVPADGQFKRDLEDLKGLLNAKPLSINSLKVVDTDDAEDLLLCGTEITGSCQRVDGDPILNRALMGFVVDGKYRMLAAKGDDGRLAARRILRLLCDSNGRPALVLERLYANAGVQAGDPVDKALIDLAKKKASAMGCRLLSDGQDLTIDAAQPCIVASLDSRAPFEYVDAHGLNVQKRRYAMNAWPVK